MTATSPDHDAIRVGVWRPTLLAAWTAVAMVVALGGFRVVDPAGSLARAPGTLLLVAAVGAIAALARAGVVGWAVALGGAGAAAALNLVVALYLAGTLQGNTLVADRGETLRFLLVAQVAAIAALAAGYWAVTRLVRAWAGRPRVAVAATVVALAGSIPMAVIGTSEPIVLDPATATTAIHRLTITEAAITLDATTIPAGPVTWLATVRGDAPRDLALVAVEARGISVIGTPASGSTDFLLQRGTMTPGHYYFTAGLGPASVIVPAPGGSEPGAADGAQDPLGPMPRGRLVAAFEVVAAAASGAGSPAPAPIPAASPAVPPDATPVLPPDASGAVATLGPVAQGLACPAAPADRAFVPTEPGGFPGVNPPRGWMEALQAMEEALMAAVGNPDVASRSPLWQAFDTATTTGDADAIRRTADAILARLRTGCAAVAPYFGLPAAVAWAVDVRGMLDGYARLVADVRDAALAGDAGALAAAGEREQVMLADHFWPSIKPDPEAHRYHPFGSDWTVLASHDRYGIGDAGRAMDGREDTAWIAGDVPLPQYLEVDLGAELSVAAVRLLTWQDGAAVTDHRLVGRTGSGRVLELAAFTGTTDDRQWLEFRPATPVDGLRWIRVTTLAAPMAGWREVEVTPAEGSAPAACPASTTPMVLLRVGGGSLAAGEDPGTVIDGDEATGVLPGPAGGSAGDAGATRGWVRVYAGRAMRISAVEVLLGPGSPAATIHVVLFPAGSELGESLGTIIDVPAAGGWVRLSGPNPCLPYESVYLDVRSPAPAARLLEVRVLGTAAD